MPPPSMVPAAPSMVLVARNGLPRAASAAYTPPPRLSKARQEAQVRALSPATAETGLLPQKERQALPPAKHRSRASQQHRVEVREVVMLRASSSPAQRARGIALSLPPASPALSGANSPSLLQWRSKINRELARKLRRWMGVTRRQLELRRAAHTVSLSPLAPQASPLSSAFDCWRWWSTARAAGLEARERRVSAAFDKLRVSPTPGTSEASPQPLPLAVRPPTAANVFGEAWEWLLTCGSPEMLPSRRPADRSPCEVKGGGQVPS